jgi:hypothetical protein
MFAGLRNRLVELQCRTEGDTSDTLDRATSDDKKEMRAATCVRSDTGTMK